MDEKRHFELDLPPAEPTKLSAGFTVPSGELIVNLDAVLVARWEDDEIWDEEKQEDVLTKSLTVWVEGVDDPFVLDATDGEALLKAWRRSWST